MPHRKQPLTIKIIYDMLHVPEGTPLGPLGVVKHNTLLWDSLVAAFEVAAQTGSRAAESGADRQSKTHHVRLLLWTLVMEHQPRADA